jgi:acetyltransferase-like isoleucine patch superfamily enzyme
LSQSNEENTGRRSESIQEDVLGLRAAFFAKHGRHVSAGDLLFDRWETAKFLGFGEGSSCYNNVLVIGDVTVGKNTWIGPNVILDGSGGLEIGDYVSISAGVQIYTHDSVDWSTSLGESSVRRMGTKLGNGVYIGPNSVVQMGTSIGDGALIVAMSFINTDVTAGAKFFGIPGRSHS